MAPTRRASGWRPRRWGTRRAAEVRPRFVRGSSRATRPSQQGSAGEERRLEAREQPEAEALYKNHTHFSQRSHVMSDSRRRRSSADQEHMAQPATRPRLAATTDADFDWTTSTRGSGVRLFANLQRVMGATESELHAFLRDGFANAVVKPVLTGMAVLESLLVHEHQPWPCTSLHIWLQKRSSGRQPLTGVTLALNRLGWSESRTLDVTFERTWMLALTKSNPDDNSGSLGSLPLLLDTLEFHSAASECVIQVHSISASGERIESCLGIAQLGASFDDSGEVSFGGNQIQDLAWPWPMYRMPADSIGLIHRGVDMLAAKGFRVKLTSLLPLLRSAFGENRRREREGSVPDTLATLDLAVDLWQRWLDSLPDGSMDTDWVLQRVAYDSSEDATIVRRFLDATPFTQAEIEVVHPYSDNDPKIIVVYESTNTLTSSERANALPLPMTGFEDLMTPEERTLVEDGARRGAGEEPRVAEERAIRAREQEPRLAEERAMRAREQEQRLATRRAVFKQTRVAHDRLASDFPLDPDWVFDDGQTQPWRHGLCYDQTMLEFMSTDDWLQALDDRTEEPDRIVVLSPPTASNRWGASAMCYSRSVVKSFLEDPTSVFYGCEAGDPDSKYVLPGGRDDKAPYIKRWVRLAMGPDFQAYVPLSDGRYMVNSDVKIFQLRPTGIVYPRTESLDVR